MARRTLDLSPILRCPRCREELCILFSRNGVQCGEGVHCGAISPIHPVEPDPSRSSSESARDAIGGTT